jgi:hypothetical protein
MALFQMLRWLGLSAAYSLSFKDYWSCGFTYLCIVPDVVLKGAQYMFTSNVNNHRVNRQLEDTCVKFRGFDSGVESDSNFKGYDAIWIG